MDSVTTLEVHSNYPVRNRHEPAHERQELGKQTRQHLAITDRRYGLAVQSTPGLAKDGLAIALEPLLQDDGLSIPKVVMGRDEAFAVHPGASILDL